MEPHSTDTCEDLDVLDILATRGAALAGVAAAGLVLRDPRDGRHGVGATDEAVRRLASLELEWDEGPCVDCYRMCSPVAHDDLTRARGAWPRFAPEALAAGYRAVQSLPLVVNGVGVGALDLFSADAGFLRPDDLRVAQAFVDAAAVAVAEHRERLDAEDLTVHLQRALDSRVVIEQAKGIVAATLGIGLDGAFERLRAHARARQLPLADVAGSVVDGSLEVACLGARDGARPSS